MNQFSGIEFNDLLVQDQNPKGAITPEDISDDVECESEDDAKLLLQSGLKSDRIEEICDTSAVLIKYISIVAYYSLNVYEGWLVTGL